jgi:hypothetical protein
MAPPECRRELLLYPAKLTIGHFVESASAAPVFVKYGCDFFKRSAGQKSDACSRNRISARR